MTDNMLNTTSLPWVSNHTETDASSGIPEGCVVLASVGEYVPWDNPDNIVSKAVTEVWERTIHGAFLPVLFLISIPTNGLNMVVFFKHGLKTRINLCLFFLSLADFVYMLQSFCLYADRIYQEVTHQPRQGALSEFMMNNNVIGLYGFSWASSWMSTIIACERCFCVVSPLRSQTILTTRTMGAFISVSFVVLVGGYFVATSKWNIVCVFDPLSSATLTAIYPSRFFLENKELVDTVDAVAYGVVVPQLCIVTVTVTTVVTAVKLRKMAEWREKSSSVGSGPGTGSGVGSAWSRDVALTRMLIGTSVLYVVSFVPGVLLRFAMLFVWELSLGGRFYNTYRLSKLTVMLCSYVNSSFNFFIYYSFGSKFRHTLRGMRCKRRGAAAARRAGSQGNVVSVSGVFITSITETRSAVRSDNVAGLPSVAGSGTL